MLLPITRLIGTPIMSIQTGALLARTSKAIIDPRRLAVMAFRVSGLRLSHPSPVLHPEDIREITDIGLIVDSDDVLMPQDDLVRLKEVISLGFELIGLKVVDENKRKLGKVESYAIEPDGFTVQQIYVKQSIFKSIGSVGLSIHRSQIVSINNNYLVVKSPTVKDEVTTTATNQSLVNPFRNLPEQQPGS